MILDCEWLGDDAVCMTRRDLSLTNPTLSLQEALTDVVRAQSGQSGI